MEKEKTVVFIGHNECFGVTSETVTSEIIKHIEKGAVYFLNGGQGGFDRLCAGCVFRLQKTYQRAVKQNLIITNLGE